MQPSSQPESPRLVTARPRRRTGNGQATAPRSLGANAAREARMLEWIDEVIVPALVKRYLRRQREQGEMAGMDAQELAPDSPGRDAVVPIRRNEIS